MERENKNKANLDKHGIDFVRAKEIWRGLLWKCRRRRPSMAEAG